MQYVQVFKYLLISQVENRIGYDFFWFEYDFASYIDLQLNAKLATETQL